jgi:hypothetical protein
MPTLPATFSVLLNQVLQTPFASFPLVTKLPCPSLIDIGRFSWMFSRRPRKIFSKAQPTVIAISKLNRAEDVHRPELIEFDVNQPIKSFDSW